MVAGTKPDVLGWSQLIAIAIIALLGIVILSYRQTVRAYPKGGSSYKEVALISLPAAIWGFILA